MEPSTRRYNIFYTCSSTTVLYFVYYYTTVLYLKEYLKQVYHCFVRGATKWQAGVKPKKVIEIGSGHSTYVAGGAMEANAKDGLGGALMSIEPYPAPELTDVFKEKNFSFQLRV